MADSESGEKGENSVSAILTDTVSVMEVDSPAETTAVSKGATTVEKKLENVAVKKDDDDFAVVEEDDGGEDDGEGFNTPEPLDAHHGDKDKSGEDSEAKSDDVLLVNPLFGKKDVPVIDIESSSSSSEEDSEEEDFSLDVSINNFHQQLDAKDGDGAQVKEGDCNLLDGSATDDVSPPQRLNENNCSAECYHEKGILVGEIERLRKAVYELNERHSVLEDFIEVEYSEKFDKFLKNRQHLVSMGFGVKDSEGTVDIIDGKRSPKSAELIELLKMIKEQSDASVKEESGSTSVAPNNKKPPSSSKGGQSQTSNQSNSKNQKLKSIPSVASQRDRGSGRGGALSYNQRPVLMPNVVSNAHSMNLQYQQQLVAQQQAQEAQVRQYYESMYGRSGMDRGEYVTLVGRTELYPSSSSRSFGGRTEGAPTRESKKQRKRKRQSEQSSEASAAGASSKNIPSGALKEPSKKNPDDDDDVEVIDYSQALNPSTKRICPLCEKILSRKSLRDHLSIVHQGHKVACPVCQVEFMQRKRIKTHMRDAHDLPVSEYSAYIDKIYSNIEEQCGPWLDKLMKEAETPTKDQLLVHNAEIQLTMLARREAKADGSSSNAQSGGAGGGITSSGNNTAVKQTPASSRSSAPATSSSSSRAGNSTSSGGGNSGRDKRDKGRDRGARGGLYSSSHTQPVRIFTGANTRVAPGMAKGYGGRETTSTDLYGPGGYAQYAARYLQQRAASGTGGVPRIYTPF